MHDLLIAYVCDIFPHRLGLLETKASVHSICITSKTYILMISLKIVCLFISTSKYSKISTALIIRLKFLTLTKSINVFRLFPFIKICLI